MKKFFKEIKEQYEYTWWWLLDQGIVISTIIVNSFMVVIFAIVMGLLVLFLKWMGKH